MYFFPQNSFVFSKKLKFWIASFESLELVQQDRNEMKIDHFHSTRASNIVSTEIF